MAGDKPSKPGYEIFSINADFNNPGHNSLGSKKPAQAGVKDGYPPKNVFFVAINPFSVKTVADRHIYTTYHDKHW